jgi:hypothetical protein
MSAAVTVATDEVNDDGATVVLVGVVGLVVVVALIVVVVVLVVVLVLVLVLVLVGAEVVVAAKAPVFWPVVAWQAATTTPTDVRASTIRSPGRIPPR